MNKPVNCRCGGEAEIFHIAPGEGYEGSYCVRCTECLIQTPFFNKDKDKAIEVWNRAMGERTAKVTDTWKVAGFDELNAWCPECKHRITRGCSYCPTCRVKLEWSE